MSLSNIIESIKTIETNDTKRSPLCIDVLDVCNRLREFEIDEYDMRYELEEFADEDIDTLNGCSLTTLYLDYLSDTGVIDYSTSRTDNTYNYNSPITHDFAFTIFDKDDGDVIIQFKVHKFGDIRGNYTESCLLSFSNEWEFFDVISEFTSNMIFNYKDNDYFVESEILYDMVKVYKVTLDTNGGIEYEDEIGELCGCDVIYDDFEDMLKELIDNYKE